MVRLSSQSSPVINRAQWQYVTVDFQGVVHVSIATLELYLSTYLNRFFDNFASVESVFPSGFFLAILAFSFPLLHSCVCFLHYSVIQFSLV